MLSRSSRRYCSLESRWARRTTAPAAAHVLEIQADAARHTQNICGLTCAGGVRRPAALSLVRSVPAREDILGSLCSLSKAVASITLSQTVCQSVGGFLESDGAETTRVVSGPPPRSEVRCPTPPAGALVCRAYSAMAATAGANPCRGKSLMK